jgi:phospholipid-binding lipoprotein MlaA
VRSTFGGLLFALVALVLGGCGTIPTGAGSQLHVPLLELSRTSLGGESVPLDPNAPGGAEMFARSKPEAAAVAAEPRPEMNEGNVPGAGAVAAPTTRAAFVPVAVDAVPPGSTHLFALADPVEAQPRPEGAAQGGATESQQDVEEIEEYDPWEPFNEKMFSFNYKFDKYLLKPVAKGYNFVMPDLFQQMIGRGFDNIKLVPKLVNNVLQWKWKGFFVELGRFVINSTLGIAGLFDIAGQEFGLDKTKVDFGQTLGKWGFKPGPFLVLPFMPPLTVRDGIGTGVDGAMDPLGYVLPFFPDRLAMRLGNMVNERSLNLDLFQGFEETTVDLYSAVRNGYLQRRYKLIHDSP